MKIENLNTTGMSVLGTVKWFDKSVGFGFVALPGLRGEALLHINTLRNFGTNMVIPGSEIEIEYETTSKGRRVCKVLSLSSSKPALETQSDETSAYEPVKVRWYSTSCDYGFVNRFKDTRDILIKGSCLRKFGRRDLAEDEALCVKIDEGTNRAKVVEIEYW